MKRKHLSPESPGNCSQKPQIGVFFKHGADGDSMCAFHIGELLGVGEDG